MGLRRRSVVAMIAAVVAAGFPILSAAAACHIATFEGDPYSVGEAEGKVTVTVSNNGGQGNGSIDIKTVDGSAKAGQDYVQKNETLTFNEPTGELSFDVTILDDTKDEQNESFRVELSNPKGCFTTIQEDSATVTILDNDEKAIVQPKPTPTPTPTPTKTSSPKPKPSTASASPSPTPTSPSPTTTTSASPIAAAEPGDGGLSGGALAGIVAATVVLGGGAAFWVRRRFLT